MSYDDWKATEPLAEPEPWCLECESLVNECACEEKEKHMRIIIEVQGGSVVDVTREGVGAEVEVIVRDYDTLDSGKAYQEESW